MLSIMSVSLQVHLLVYPCFRHNTVMHWIITSLHYKSKEGGPHWVCCCKSWPLCDGSHAASMKLFQKTNLLHASTMLPVVTSLDECHFDTGCVLQTGVVQSWKWMWQGHMLMHYEPAVTCVKIVSVCGPPYKMMGADVLMHLIHRCCV